RFQRKEESFLQVASMKSLRNEHRKLVNEANHGDAWQLPAAGRAKAGGISSCTGQEMAAWTSVPLPGVERNETCPPRSCARSCMLTSPRPSLSRAASGSKPGPSSRMVTHNSFGVSDRVTVTAAPGACLAALDNAS